RVHRDGELYDRLFHHIRMEKGSFLEELYGTDLKTDKVNSVHHQAVKDLGKNLVVEAVAHDDGVIEAIRCCESEPFVFCIQWHADFQDQTDRIRLNSKPLLRHFLDQARKLRGK